MKIIDRVKNKIIELSIPFFEALPTPQKEITPTKSSSNPEEKDEDISEEDIIKFKENAIEYNPETKSKMVSYYQDHRDKPKQAYIIGQIGKRIDINTRTPLGNGFIVKRKTES